jgi:hypothetical protein
MYRIFVLGALCLAGCQNVIGPFQARDPRRVDDPCLPISEQERLGRDRLAFPEESPTFAPLTYVDRPGPHGR